MNREHSSNDNVDILTLDPYELWSLIWRKKPIIIISVLLAVSCSVLYAYFLPSIYRVEAVLSPAEPQNSQGSANALLNQVGALRAIGGVGAFDTSSNKSRRSLAILRSRAFTNSFLNEYDIVPAIIAGQEGSAPRSFIIDSSKYNGDTGEWLIGFNGGTANQPTEWNIYAAFSEIIDIVQDVETGLITIRLDWYDPDVAKKWLSWLIEDINAHIKRLDLVEAEQAIEFLQEQVISTQLVEMRNVFYNLIEAQTQVVMLADAREGYAFEVIDPPIILDQNIQPGTMFLMLIGLICGLILGVVIIFVMRLLEAGSDHLNAKVSPN